MSSIASAAWGRSFFLASVLQAASTHPLERVVELPAHAATRGSVPARRSPRSTQPSAQSKTSAYSSHGYGKHDCQLGQSAQRAAQPLREV